MNADPRSALLGLVIALLIPGCGLLDSTPENTSRPEDDTVIHRLEDLNLTLELPSDFVQQARPMDTSAFRFCNEAERFMRVMHCFSIEPVPTLPVEDMTDWNTEPLTGAGVFYYRTEEAGGGSGGGEEVLEGYLVLGDHIFKVGAHDQKEFPAKPDATWVIPVIRTARYGESEAP